MNMAFKSYVFSYPQVFRILQMKEALRGFQSIEIFPMEVLWIIRLELSNPYGIPPPSVQNFVENLNAGILLTLFLLSRTFSRKANMCCSLEFLRSERGINAVFFIFLYFLNPTVYEELQVIDLILNPKVTLKFWPLARKLVFCLDGCQL